MVLSFFFKNALIAHNSFTYFVYPGFECALCHLVVHFLLGRRFLYFWNLVGAQKLYNFLTDIVNFGLKCKCLLFLFFHLYFHLTALLLNKP